MHSTHLASIFPLNPGLHACFSISLTCISSVIFGFLLAVFVVGAFFSFGPTKSAPFLRHDKIKQQETASDVETESTSIILFLFTFFQIY